jgi:fatty acid desaturase
VVHDIPIGLKRTLVDDDGRDYRSFRARLTPRWGLVWLQLGAGYLALAAIVGGLAAWDPSGIAAVAAALGGAVLVGYVVAYLNNFFHEAAHYNVAPGRRANDLLTNLAMAWLYGTSIGLYRRVHFQHHRALGTTMDSESSYFDPLRVRYLAEGLLGVRALKSLRRHQAATRNVDEGEEDGGGARIGWALVALAVNGALVAALALAGAWSAAGAWALGEVAFFPFFVSLRQLLEHRDEEADAETDYFEVDHGATNRLFGDGPVASTLGSAGFNRHALHHWEPQVSCTRLRELERYLSRTELAPYLAERRTTYWATLLRLLEP